MRFIKQGGNVEEEKKSKNKLGENALLFNKSDKLFELMSQIS